VIASPLRPGQSPVEPCPLGEADTVELTLFGFVSEFKGHKIALNAMRASGGRLLGNGSTFGARHLAARLKNFPAPGAAAET
jgi:hypothetical protein